MIKIYKIINKIKRFLHIFKRRNIRLNLKLCLQLTIKMYLIYTPKWLRRQNLRLWGAFYYLIARKLERFWAARLLKKVIDKIMRDWFRDNT
jgi:hypothetical protein